MILFVKRNAYKQGDSDVMTLLLKKSLRDGKENPHDSVCGDLSFIIKELFIQKDFHHGYSCLGYGCTRTEDSCYACLVKEVVILCRDDTTGDDHNVLAAQLLQFGDKLWYQGLMTCGK